MGSRHHKLLDVIRVGSNPLFAGYSFDLVVAYISGYDAACDGGLLIGFREWLVLKLKDGRNLSWPGLVTLFVFPDSRYWSGENKMSPEDDALAIRGLFSLISEFDEIRSRPEGLKQIFFDFFKWDSMQVQPRGSRYSMSCPHSN